MRLRLVRTETEQECSKCGVMKPYSEYGKNKSRKNGLNDSCKVCWNAYKKKPEIRERANKLQRERAKKPNISAYHKEYRKKYRETERGRERINDYFMKKLYGITIEQYNNMFSNQGGCCAICGIHQQELTKRLAVDHCHSSGKIRELLCHGCNTGLGNLKENIEILEKCVSYLNKHKGE